jgi:hypothetical protein
MPSCRRNIPIANVGRLARHEFDKISLPPEDMNLPHHGSNFVTGFLTKNSHCFIESFLSEIGSPKYMKGNSPNLQFR